MSADRHNAADVDVAGTMAKAAKTAAPTRDVETSNERLEAMFGGIEAAGYRTQWDAIQTGFVDEPRRAVEEADALVALVVKRLAEVFAEERTTLERQWDRGDEISTEDLRVALRKYRSFFERLLTL
jgi:hypothetical protein